MFWLKAKGFFCVCFENDSSFLDSIRVWCRRISCIDTPGEKMKFRSLTEMGFPNVPVAPGYFDWSGVP